MKDGPDPAFAASPSSQSSLSRPSGLQSGVGALTALELCVEHMEWSTPQGRHAYEKAREALRNAGGLIEALDHAYRVIDWYAFDFNNDEGSRARAVLPELEKVLGPYWDALAAGTRSAETARQAQSEGCQSGGDGRNVQKEEQ